MISFPFRPATFAFIAGLILSSLSLESTDAFATGTVDCGVEIAGVFHVSTESHLRAVGKATDPSEPCQLDDNYKQVNDIALGPNEWEPIGDGNLKDPFQGTYDGGGFEISGLTVSMNQLFVGMFGYAGTHSQILNVRLVDGSVTGTGDVGGLVAWNAGYITNSHSELTVTGTDSDMENVGGLVGWSDGVIDSSSATGPVTGFHDVGGLVGQLGGGSITRSFASGDVLGLAYVGGLVGFLEAGLIQGSWATGTVNGTGKEIGGLVGRQEDGLIQGSWASGDVSGGGESIGGLLGRQVFGLLKESWASGDVTGLDNVGGLVGRQQGAQNSGQSGRLIEDSWASGDVSGVDSVGGLVGQNSGVIRRAYSRGTVQGSSSVGGLVGSSSSGGVTHDSFWDVTSSQVGSADVAASSGGTGKSSAQMRSVATFLAGSVGITSAWPIVEGWSAASNGNPTWGICPQFNDGFPYLLSQATVNPCASTPATQSSPPGVTGGSSLADGLSSQCLAKTGPSSALLSRLLIAAAVLGASGLVVLMARRWATVSSPADHTGP